jgi:hypothetical protein
MRSMPHRLVRKIFEKPLSIVMQRLPRTAAAVRSCEGNFLIDRQDFLDKV